MAEAIVDMEVAFQGEKRPWPLRAGLASGPVILFEGDDYIGKAVNMAARLCAVAKPGEVLGDQVDDLVSHGEYRGHADRPAHG